MRTVVKLATINSTQCPSSIRKAIGFQPGVYATYIDMAKKEIIIEHTDEISSSELHKIIESTLENSSFSCSK